MIVIYRLIIRILSGEKYGPATREDTRIWLALLAALPPEMGVAFVWAKLADNWHLVFVWLSLMAFGILFCASWYLIWRINSLILIGILIFAGWTAAFATAIYLNQ